MELHKSYKTAKTCMTCVFCSAFSMESPGMNAIIRVCRSGPEPIDTKETIKLLKQGGMIPTQVSHNAVCDLWVKREAPDGM